VSDGPAYDAIVIGAGVIGSSIALELARDGRRTCVVDRGAGAGAGSTSASSAIVRYNYSTWVGVVAAWESRHRWESWPEHLGGGDDAGMARLVRTGGLFLESPQQDVAKVLALFDRVGIPYEEWDAATIRRRLPQLDPSRHYPPKPVTDDAFWGEPHGELGGYWTPDIGFIDDPQLAAHNLMVAARRIGASFRFHAEVSAVRRRAGRVAGVELTSAEVLEAPVVVNVAGPHSARINALADVLGDFTVSTRPMRQEVHHLPAPPGYNAGGAPGPLVADLDLGTYFRGTPGDGLMVGGVEPECDPMQWLDDPDAYDPNPTQPVYRAQVLRVARRLPGLTIPETARGIAGVYDVSDDWIPIYDRTALPGFYVAIGTSGNQFKNAPVVGRFIAAIVEASENGRDHDTDPVSLQLEHTGLTVDLSHYSRRRPVNQDSSFTVMG
jgi:sarcosine oxidase subunit beta